MSGWTFIVTLVAKGKIVEELKEFDKFEDAKDQLRIYNKKFYHQAWLDHKENFIIIAKRCEYRLV